MKFNEKTREALNLGLRFNDSMVIEYPVTGIKMNKKAKMFIHMDKLEEKFDKFAIFSTSEMLQCVDIVQEAEISVKDGFININTPDTLIKYKTSSVELIEDDAWADYDDTNIDNTIAEFVLTAIDLDKIKKASKAFNDYNSLKLSNNNGSLNISVSSKASSRTAYDINIPGSFNAPDVYIMLDVIDAIPAGEYEVKVYSGAETQVLFKNDVYEILLGAS